MDLERKVRFQLWFMQSAVFRLLSWLLSLGIPRKHKPGQFRDGRR
jgi:hypothetical protein